MARKKIAEDEIVAIDNEIQTDRQMENKTDIRSFESLQFGELRTAKREDGSVWFCLKDIARALGLNNQGELKKRLKVGGVITTDTSSIVENQYGKTSNTKELAMTFIDEANLYRCIFQSRKAEAEKFQDWVFEEVLPSIRQSGGYIASKPDESPEMLMARALEVARLTIEKNKLKLEENKKQMQVMSESILLQEQKIEEQAPKVAFANAMMSSATSCLVGELAKIITQNGVPIGQNKLFEWLRREGYLGKKGEYFNIPTQKYMEKGYFELKKGVRSGSNGVLHTTITPKVTPKGQEHILSVLLHSVKVDNTHRCYSQTIFN